MDSTAKRNGSSKPDFDVPAKLRQERLDRGPVAEAFARGEVDGHRNLLDVGFIEVFEVRPARQPSSDATVGVFDPALLPARVGVAEIRCCAQHPAQQHVAGEAGVVVERDRAAHPWIEPPERGHHRSDGLARGLAGQARHQRDAGLALVQHQHRAGPFADHQVGFPVTHCFAGVSVVRSLGNVGFLGDRVARRPAGALPSTGMVAGQEAPESPCLLVCAVDPAVDRLRRDSAETGLDPEPQPSGDLFRRPALGQAVRDIGRELRIHLDQRLALTAQHVRPIRHVRPVGAAVERIAPDLARDGRRRPAKRPGHRPKRQPLGLQSGEPIPFSGGEMSVF